MDVHESLWKCLLKGAACHAHAQEQEHIWSIVERFLAHASLIRHPSVEICDPVDPSED